MSEVLTTLADWKATEYAYLVSAGLFILSLYWMNNPQTARRSVLAGVAAMSLASIAQLIAIAPFGLGPREGILLLLASSLGITAAQALALSALLFLLQLVNGIVGFVVWLWERPATPRPSGQAPDARATDESRQQASVVGER